MPFLEVYKFALHQWTAHPITTPTNAKWGVPVDRSVLPRPQHPPPLLPLATGRPENPVSTCQPLPSAPAPIKPGLDPPHAPNILPLSTPAADSPMYLMDYYSELKYTVTSA